MEKEFKSDYERLKHKFNALKKNIKNLKKITKVQNTIMII